MGLFGNDNSNESLIDAMNKNRDMLNQIDLPKYKEYAPQLYDNQSYNYKLTSDDPVVKSKQLEALSQLQGLSSKGLSDADVAGFEKARGLGDQMAKANTDAALQNAQARGVAGGGMEFAMREAGDQAASQRANEAALQQAATASQNRNQYLQAYAGQLGNVRSQDYQTNAANSNVINQFNQMNTSARNQTANANVDQKNNAFMYNQGLQDKNYQNQMQKTGQLMGINTQQGQATAAQDEANRQRTGALVGLAGAGIGAAVGGPAGAAVGYQAGRAIY